MPFVLSKSTFICDCMLYRMLLSVRHTANPRQLQQKWEQIDHVYSIRRMSNTHFCYSSSSSSVSLFPFLLDILTMELNLCFEEKEEKTVWISVLACYSDWLYSDCCEFRFIVHLTFCFPLIRYSRVPIYFAIRMFFKKRRRRVSSTMRYFVETKVEINLV